MKINGLYLITIILEETTQNEYMLNSSCVSVNNIQWLFQCLKPISCEDLLLRVKLYNKEVSSKDIGSSGSHEIGKI